MGQNKFSCSGVEAHIKHWEQGNSTAGGEDDIQGEYIAQEAINNGGQGSTAGAGGLDKAQNRTTVFLGQGKHQTGVEDGVAGTVRDGGQETEDAQQKKLVGKIGQNKKHAADGETDGHDPKADLGTHFPQAQQYHTA